MGSYMEIFEARVLGGNLSFWFEKSPILRIVSCLHDNLRKQDAILKIGDFSTKN
jgi:hypothetical protein